MRHQAITTPGAGPQRGTVTCTEAPGQTCLRKDMGNGVFLCKCYPTACGSAWSQAPGCQTITWKEPVIAPSQVPRPFQSRPPARGRQMARATARTGNPFCWNDTYCPAPYVCKNFECVPPPITAPPQKPQPSSMPAAVRKRLQRRGRSAVATTPDKEPAPKCGYQQRWCKSLGICVPDVAGACPSSPDFTARPQPVPQPRPRPVAQQLPTARPSAPRPSSVPRSPSRGRQIQRAALAVR